VIESIAGIYGELGRITGKEEFDGLALPMIEGHPMSELRNRRERA
jgi:hypothetical protein